MKMIKSNWNKCMEEKTNRNNDTVLISVIVPVYNVERYVSRCVDSILNQSY